MTDAPRTVDPSQSSPPGPPPALLGRLSRELALACDPAGLITWADPRAEHMLGAPLGRSLRCLCAPGTEDKADLMLESARRAAISGWELSLLVAGQPATVTFGGALDEAGALWLVGTLIPEHFARALTSVEQAMQESVRLHREVLTQKRELERRHRELERMTAELHDSNRGLVTLHAEVAGHAEELRREAEIKARVVANVSHEFRTPLHSVLGLGQLLLDETDGPLNSEQRKQVQFMRSASEELLQLVNDVLDLTRAEAGRAALRIEPFTLGDLVASLRGMLRPLVPKDSPVELAWDEPDRDLVLETDRGKLAQVLRNLVANALKFTPRGEVRVRAERDPAGVRFTVKDTGIGIPAGQLDSIFEEFTQVESPVQAQVQGSGLGLPLARRLAELLGGEIGVESTPGAGSTFTVVVPCNHPEVAALAVVEVRARESGIGPASILVVEDDRKSIFIYDKYLSLAGFHVIPARSIEAARAVLAEGRPAAIVLDIVLENETSWSFLADIKKDPRTCDIPVLVVTLTNREQKARALGADEFWLKPIDRDQLLRRLKSLARPNRCTRVLIVDDDDTARYLMHRHLQAAPFEVTEAATGPEAIEAARSWLPHVIFLDFLLADMTAFDVLDELKADPRTRSIPVIIVTSHVLEAADRQRLLEMTEAVITKEHLSRELAINRIRDALAKVGVANLPPG